jgi:phosphoglycerate kinase
MALPLLQDYDVNNKRVLVRVDFNVPLDQGGHIADDTRIKEALPTIQWLIQHHARVILLSHLGRPKKEDPSLSLRICSQRLSELIKHPVQFVSDITSPHALQASLSLQPGELLLMENLRFHKGEEHPESDPGFAQALARLGDFYVDDAFATAHRAHASTATIATFFPKRRAAGFLLQKEIEQLTTLLKSPSHPFFAIIGGAKVSSKLGILKSLIGKVDAFFIGGGMAYTFLKTQGTPIGSSLEEAEMEGDAKIFLESCKKNHIPVRLPEDFVIADRFADDADKRIVSVKQGIPNGWQGLDIGPLTLKAWQSELITAKTVFWNGPVGVFEFSSFALGTQGIAATLASLQAITVVGGGDSVSAVHQLGLEKNFSHVSTGGGASLEFLEYGTLPGIEALL